MINFLFDIGCSIGKWIDANYNETDMFVGVEPNPHVYERVREKFADKVNVQILNYLVAEVDDEERDFYIDTKELDGEASTASVGWMRNTRHKETTKWADPIKIRTITLDTLISQFGIPLKVKIDVEGYELNVLQGLSQKAGYISFEFAAEDMPAARDCLERLSVLGYKRFHIHHGDGFTHKPDIYKRKEEIFPFLRKHANTTAWGMVYASPIDFKVKIISLETRPYRLKAAVGELPKIGVTEYEWFPAFTGGALGCERSHIACLKGDGALLILEDDVVFEPDAAKTMMVAMAQLPDDWDILYLGANVKVPASRHSDNLFRVRSGVHTTHAMLYSPKGRKNTLRLYKEQVSKPGVLPIDHWLYTSGLNLMNCYVVWPMIAFQRPDHSDIRLAYYDYREEMLMNQRINMV